jgi:hypothetical protein
MTRARYKRRHRRRKIKGRDIRRVDFPRLNVIRQEGGQSAQGGLMQLVAMTGLLEKKMTPLT